MTRLSHKLALVALVAGAVIAFAGCADNVTNPVPTRYFFFTFEGSIEGWSKNGLDLGNPDDRWDINLSLDYARDSTTSVRFFLNNLNDKGKIYIERAFDADTSADYEVRVSYQLASRDFGDVNLWTLITGASLRPASSAADLTMQGSTWNGYSSDVGYSWISRSYTFPNVKSSSNGKIYVQIGVWGTSEFQRSYYLDSVYVVLVKK